MDGNSRFAEALIAFVTWPLEKAQGESAFVRLMAVTIGWLWMVPAFFAVTPIMIVIIAPMILWKDLQ